MIDTLIRDFITEFDEKFEGVEFHPGNVVEKSKELIMIGMSISNVGYYVKKVLRDNEINKKKIESHNKKVCERSKIENEIAELFNQLNTIIS